MDKKLKRQKHMHKQHNRERERERVYRDHLDIFSRSNYYFKFYCISMSSIRAGSINPLLDLKYKVHRYESARKRINISHAHRLSSNEALLKVGMNNTSSLRGSHS